MSVKSRLLALKLLEKQERHPDFAKKIGVKVNVVSRKKVKPAYECTGIKKEEK